MNYYVAEFLNHPLYYSLLVVAYSVVGYGLVVACRKIFKGDKVKEEQQLSEDIESYFKKKEGNGSNLNTVA